MITIRKVDVAGRIEELLERVAAGDEVEILDGIRPFARLSPATVEREGAKAAERIAAIERVRAMMPPDLTVEEMLRYRDEGRR